MTKEEATQKFYAISEQLHAAEAASSVALATLMKSYADALEFSAAAGIPAYQCQKSHKRMQASIASGFADLSARAVAHESLHNTFKVVMPLPTHCPPSDKALEEDGNNVVDITKAA